jgi:hypothetical protein
MLIADTMFLTGPMWYFVAAVVVVASLPWLLNRFRLRTLQIAMTLVAVVLGLIIYASR